MKPLHRHDEPHIKSANVLLVGLMAAAILTLNVSPAGAADQTGDPTNWAENFRRWPWKGGTQHDLTQIEGHGYASSSARKAFDIGMPCGKAVYSVSKGTVIAAVSSSGAAGKYVQVTHDANNDGTNTVVTYEHLQSIEVDADNGGGKPTALLQGDLIGYSGNSGTKYCHLHLQRSASASFDSDAWTLGPINGLEVSELNLSDDYISANVGIGRKNDMTIKPAIKATYRDFGDYFGVGIPANIGVAYSPCRSARTTGTSWAYACNASTTYRGTVQTFYGRAYRQKAIMLREGTSTAYLVSTGILAAFTDRHSDGRDFVFHIGYPTGNRQVVPSTGGTQRYTQSFQGGRIDYSVTSTGQCSEKIYQGSTLIYSAPYCD